MNTKRLEAIQSILVNDLADFSEAIARSYNSLCEAIKLIPEHQDANAKELWQSLEVLITYANFADLRLENLEKQYNSEKQQ